MGERLPDAAVDDAESALQRRAHPDGVDVVKCMVPRVGHSRNPAGGHIDLFSSSKHELDVSLHCVPPHSIRAYS